MFVIQSEVALIPGAREHSWEGKEHLSSLISFITHFLLKDAAEAILKDI